MKKIISIAIISIIAFTSCKKGSSGSNKYHVSFTVNGTNKVFTGYVAAHFDTTLNTVSLTVLGADSSTAFDNYFGFYLDNYTGGAPIISGQYTDAMTNYTLLSNYTVNGVEHDAGQTVASEAVINNVTIANHFKATITSITSTTVSGTFSGDFYQDGDVVNGTKLTITNGDFYVLRQ